MSEEVSGALSVPNKPSGFCGRKAVFTTSRQINKHSENEVRRKTGCGVGGGGENNMKNYKIGATYEYIVGTGGSGAGGDGGGGWW